MKCKEKQKWLNKINQYLKIFYQLMKNRVNYLDNRIK